VTRIFDSIRSDVECDCRDEAEKLRATSDLCGSRCVVREVSSNVGTQALGATRSDNGFFVGGKAAIPEIFPVMPS